MYVTSDHRRRDQFADASNMRGIIFSFPDKLIATYLSSVYRMLSFPRVHIYINTCNAFPYSTVSQVSKTLLSNRTDLIA
jgi:hypothetical protein